MKIQCVLPAFSVNFNANLTSTNMRAVVHAGGFKDVGTISHGLANLQLYLRLLCRVEVWSNTVRPERDGYTSFDNDTWNRPTP